MVAETRISVEALGRKIEEWRLKLNKPDNHYLDTLTMCTVGASMVGAKLAGGTADPGQAKAEPKKPKKPAVTYMEV
jgi:hypothetical protein